MTPTHTLASTYSKSHVLRRPIHECIRTCGTSSHSDNSKKCTSSKLAPMLGSPLLRICWDLVTAQRSIVEQRLFGIYMHYTHDTHINTHTSPHPYTRAPAHTSAWSRFTLNVPAILRVRRFSAVLLLLLLLLDGTSDLSLYPREEVEKID